MVSFKFIVFQTKSRQTKTLPGKYKRKWITEQRTIYKIKNVCTRMYQYYPFSNIINLTPIMSAMCWGRKGESVLEITSQFYNFLWLFSTETKELYIAQKSRLCSVRKKKTNDLSTVFPKANLQLHASTDLCYLLYCWEIELVVYYITHLFSRYYNKSNIAFEQNQSHNILTNVFTKSFISMFLIKGLRKTKNQKDIF